MSCGEGDWVTARVSELLRRSVSELLRRVSELPVLWVTKENVLAPVKGFPWR